MRKRVFSFLILLVVVFIFGCANVLPSIGMPAILTLKDEDTLRIHCLYIGQGDATLIHWQGKWTLIDAGDVEYRSEIVRLLKEEYSVKKVENLIITHNDSDHLGGAYAVLNNFPVKNVYENGHQKRTYVYRTYLKTLAKKGLQATTLRKGMEIDLGGDVRLEILSPDEKPIKKDGEIDHNNNSIVAMLRYKDFSMLFTGDAEAVQETKLVRSYGKKLKADILHVGHHGSYTSSTKKFLQKVRPKKAIISCGRDNPYGMPHEKVKKNLQEIKAKVFRTDLDGTITISTDGKKMLQKEN